MKDDRMRKIVIDIYGADAGIEPVVAGTAKALNMGIPFFPVMVGSACGITKLMECAGIAADRYEIVDTDKFISQEDPATCVFGDRDDSSMVMAYTRLKNDPECAAMLSPGNTGALLVGSICRLGLLPGLKFPALASALPCVRGKLICLVDCGANVDCTAADLVRFATMGSIFSRSCCGIHEPRVGLMNVGREKQKGNALTREAFEKISQLPLNFVGNLEGSDMVSGYADVIVTDGFSGNLLLKSTEAVGKAAIAIVEEMGIGADPAVISRIKQALWETFDFNSQGAATFLGPRKTVVKMHGCANEDTTVASIRQILRLEDAGFSQAMAEAMSK